MYWWYHPQYIIHSINGIPPQYWTPSTGDIPEGVHMKSLPKFLVSLPNFMFHIITLQVITRLAGMEEVSFAYFQAF